MVDECQELLNLSRLAMTGNKQDVQLFIGRLARRMRAKKPEIADKLDDILTSIPHRGAPLRRATSQHLPVDADSRLHLMRIDEHPRIDNPPIWAEVVSRALEQITSERLNSSNLLKEGLHPTKSALFTGAPGVGKSLAAKWIAGKLQCPLVTLDLSAVMSSYLGRTGVNVRQVLDYAKTEKCVLLLDELDAVAKRRDDAAEIGELKRLVTVLLQEIDEWPPSGLLVAATNHPDLLDPAVWRRFEMIVEFPMPTLDLTRAAIERFLASKEVSAETVDIMANCLADMSFSDLEREILKARRESVTSGAPLEATIQRVVHDAVQSMHVKKRKSISMRLSRSGLSERDVNSWTGIHRSTLRSSLKAEKARKSEE